MTMQCNAKTYTQICGIKNIQCKDKGIERFLNDFCNKIQQHKLKCAIELCVCDNSACPQTQSVVCGAGKSDIFDILIVQGIYKRNKCIKRYIEVEIKSIHSPKIYSRYDHMQEIINKFNYTCCDYTSSQRFLVPYLDLKLAKKIIKKLDKLLKKNRIQVMLAEDFIKCIVKGEEKCS